MYPKYNKFIIVKKGGNVKLFIFGTPAQRDSIRI